MKIAVEERKKMTSAEKGLKRNAESLQRIEREVRTREAIEQRKNEAIAMLVQNRPKYLDEYNAAISSDDEAKGVILKDILSLVDCISSLKDKISFVDIEAILPNKDGEINLQEAKEVLSKITKFVRSK